MGQYYLGKVYAGEAGEVKDRVCMNSKFNLWEIEKMGLGRAMKS